MKNFIIEKIAESLQSGILQGLIISALRKLVTRTENNVDDKIVDLLESALKNEEIDSMIMESLAKVAEKNK